MKKNNLIQFILLVTMIFSMESCLHDQIISQPYFIYHNNEKIVVKGQVDGNVVYKNADAATAINNAIELLNKQKGGELKLSNGIYTINSPINLASNINLIGSGNATVLKMGKENEKGIVILAEEVEEIRVSDLTLQGIEEVKASSGIIYDHVGMGIINNVCSRDFGQYGIVLRNDCFMCEVVSCQTSGNDSAGVYLSRNNFNGRGGNSVPNLISNCKSYGEAGHAFELFRSTCNNLIGNIVYQCLGHGFYIHTHSCSNLLSGNRVFSGFQNAVYCDRAPETNITGNIFCWNKGHGIEFKNVVWGTISGNNIIDNGDVIDYSNEGWTTGYSYGIYMHSDTRSVQVSGNAIFNWPDGHPPMIDGIYESEDCSFNNFTGNNVQFYTGLPVNSNGKNSIEANNLGNPHFYERFWSEVKLENQTEPFQGILKPLSREVVDEMLEKIRK